MPDSHGNRPVYTPPVALLAGGLGAVGLGSSGLFTGRDSPAYSGTESLEQSSGGTDVRCTPGFNATGCSPGTGVTSVSI